MPRTLFILNDPPYGTERSYNALRLAGSLARREGRAARGESGACATCMDARGIADAELTDTTRGSTLEELTDCAVGGSHARVLAKGRER